MSPALPLRACTTAAAAIVMAVAGCATRPPAYPGDADVTIPAAWSQPGPAGAVPLARWWRAFGDETLSGLVERAVAAGTDVRTAEANLRQARALRDIAAAALRPALATSASVQHTRAAGNLFDAGFDASWEADLFGRLGHDVAARDADVQARGGSLAATRVSIAAEAAIDYVQMRGSQARLMVARGNLGNQEQTLQIARWREQAGLGSSLDVAQARAAVEQTRAQLPVLEASIAQAQHALAALCGLPPDALRASLSGNAALPPPPRDLALAVPAQALRQRPDVFAAERALRAAAERVAQADAERRPLVQLRASLAWSALTLSSLGGNAAAATLLGTASQPLYDGGARDAQLAAQQAAFDAAREAYRASVLQALQDVEDALAGLAAARGRVDALRAAAEAAGDAALLAGHRYASGLIDFQTVLETQRTLLAVQDGVASAETELAADHVRLYKALGGGWDRAAPGEDGS